MTTVAHTMTDRQTAMLAYITRYWAEHGYGPTLRGLVAALGLTSTSVASYNVHALADRGLVAIADDLRQSTIRPMTYGNHWRDGRYWQ